MARIKGALHSRKRHKRVLKLAKGYYGSQIEAVPHSESCGDAGAGERIYRT